MYYIYICLFFILGLLMGSFFTVVGLRLPRKESFLVNRSYCDNCHHKLSFFDMIPVFSYLSLKGRCRYCGNKISNMSTYMELFCGVLFCLAYIAFSFSFNLFIALGIISMLMIISVSDMTYLIIPDEVLYFFTGYFLIIYTLQYGVIDSLIRILSGLVLFFVMYGILLLGNFLFRKESLGGGDVKLMFIFGIILHPLIGLISIFLASFIALPISLYFLYSKNQKLIPFGPFLLISLCILFFMKIDVSFIIEIIKNL